MDMCGRALPAPRRGAIQEQWSRIAMAEPGRAQAGAARWLAAGAALVMATALSLGAAHAAGPGEQPVDPYDGAGASPPRAPDQQPDQQPVDPYRADAPADSIDDQVAGALYRRALYLLHEGDPTDAKMLLVESLERSPHGPSSTDALRMLRQTNRSLGLSDPDDGRPGEASTSGGTLDARHAGGGSAGDLPINPYGASQPAPEGAAAGQSTLGRRAVIGWSGALGFITGLALAGPEDDQGNVSGGAVVVGLLGAGAGVGLSYWLTGRSPMTAGQDAAVVSGATWGAFDIGLLGDVFTGTSSEDNDVWKYVAAGGLIGVGGGAVYARMAQPSGGQVAFINSLAAYGAGAGLLFGVAIDPPHGEAYSLNATLGSAAGLVAGAVLAPRLRAISRKRTLLVDAGAVVGAAAPWVLLYPLIQDGSSNNDEQVSGLLSALTLGGGAVAAWFLTRGVDPAVPAPEGEEAAGSAAPPALAQRDVGGGWHLGLPLPRPMVNPVLAPAPAGRSMGLDVLAGRF